MTGASTASASPRVTVAAIRAHITAGDLAAARPAFEALRARLGPVTEVLVTEGLLQEAEGDLEASLASFEQARACAPGSVYPSGQVARILTRLERPAEAEAAALATLALDDANALGLTALAHVYARTGRMEERLGVVRRLAASPGASGAKVWASVGELAAADRWADVLHILDGRADDLPPARLWGQRVEALIALDRQRDALACLTAAIAAGHVTLAEMVDRLLARRALALAAAFVQQCPEGQPGAALAREAVFTAATRTSNGASLEASPFDFADAVRALDILMPGREDLNRAVGRAAAFLVEQARVCVARGEFGPATDHLIRAARLAPADPAVLEMLADAAGRADRGERRLDTLLRIHRVRPHIDSLMAAVLGAMAAGRWDTLGELMSRAENDGLIASGDIETVEEIRTRLRGRFEDFLRGGDVEGGLALVAGLRPWKTAPDWPLAAIARLLAVAKRRLRAPRAPAAVGQACALYLRVDPDDVDVGRLWARLHLRLGRFGEAAELLAHVVRIDPHAARDWLDLAEAREKLGDPAMSDACMARALVIAPTGAPAERVARFWARMAPA